MWQVAATPNDDELMVRHCHELIFLRKDNLCTNALKDRCGGLISANSPRCVTSAVFGSRVLTDELYARLTCVQTSRASPVSQIPSLCVPSRTGMMGSFTLHSKAGNILGPEGMCIKMEAFARILITSHFTFLIPARSRHDSQAPTSEFPLTW